MKKKMGFKKIKFYIVILLFIPLLSAKCSKTTVTPTPPKTPLEQLPKATQTGNVIKLRGFHIVSF